VAATLVLQKNLLNKACLTWTTFLIVVLPKWRLVVSCSRISLAARTQPTLKTKQTPNVAIATFLVMTSKMLGTTSLTTYVTNTILYPVGEPIFNEAEVESHCLWSEDNMQSV
jgi:hypothetical protein